LHHKARGCHRDLKSHNVLYDKQLNIKLCDFAFSKFKAELERKTVKFESRVGTPQWMAPEVLRGEDYTFSAGEQLILPFCLTYTLYYVCSSDILMMNPLFQNRQIRAL
jgi:serine/threonine protein kinase